MREKHWFPAQPSTDGSRSQRTTRAIPRRVRAASVRESSRAPQSLPHLSVCDFGRDMSICMQATFAPGQDCFRCRRKGRTTGRFREAVEITDMLLRNDTTSYAGRYYQLDEAPMRPASLQRPRVTASPRARELLTASSFIEMATFGSPFFCLLQIGSRQTANRPPR